MCAEIFSLMSMVVTREQGTPSVLAELLIFLLVRLLLRFEVRVINTVTNIEIPISGPQTNRYVYICIQTKTKTFDDKKQSTYHKHSNLL